MSKFHFRDADTSANDVEFIAAAFDSTLPYLASTGNGEQWGAQPWSERDGFTQSTKDEHSHSETFRQTGQGERLRVFIAELEDPSGSTTRDGLVRRTDDEGRTFLPVGTLTIRDDEFAQHISSHEILGPIVKEAKDKGGFVWIDVIVADFRVEQGRKGVGAAMIDKAKEYGREHEKSALYLDYWTGGTGRLKQYYKSLGFELVHEYEFKRNNGTIWPGDLVRMDLSDSQ